MQRNSAETNIIKCYWPERIMTTTVSVYKSSVIVPCDTEYWLDYVVTVMNKYHQFKHSTSQ